MRDRALLFVILSFFHLVAHCSINTSKGYITYKEFGAFLDGEHDDYEAVRKCHEFANKNVIPVYSGKGLLFINGQHKEPIIVRTNSDLSDCDFIVDDTYCGRNIFSIEEDIDNQLIDISDKANLNINEFCMNSILLPCLSSYKHSFFVINGSRVLGVRPGATPIPYKNCECFTTLSDGVLTDGKLYCDYTKDNISLFVKSTTSKKIIFKYPTIRFKITRCQTNYNQTFEISRNNTDIELPREFIYDSYPTTGTCTNAMCLIAFKNCCGVSIHGGNCENRGRLPNEQLQRTCYVMNFRCCSDIHINNVKLYRGWGALNTEFIKSINISDSYLNRFDNHFGVSDVTISNTTIVGSNNCLNIGYGDGMIDIRNLKYIIAETSSEKQTSLLNFREDIRLTYRGSVNLDNVSISSAVEDVTLYLITCFDKYNTTNNTYINEQNSIRRISMKDVYVDPTVKKMNLLYHSFALSSKPLTIESIKLDNLYYSGDADFLTYITDKNGSESFLTLNKMLLQDCFVPNLHTNNSGVRFIQDIIIDEYSKKHGFMLNQFVNEKDE